MNTDDKGRFVCPRFTQWGAGRRWFSSGCIRGFSISISEFRFIELRLIPLGAGHGRAPEPRQAALPKPNLDTRPTTRYTLRVRTKPCPHDHC